MAIEGMAIGGLYVGVMAFWLVAYMQNKKDYLRTFFLIMSYVHMLGGLALLLNYTLLDLATATSFEGMQPALNGLFTVDLSALFVLFVLIIFFETKRGVDMIRKVMGKFRQGG